MQQAAATTHLSRSERVQEHAFERRWWVLAVLCFSLLVIVLDNSILNVAIPTIERELSASNSQIQWIIDAYILVFAGLLLTMGSLGDRYGRRGALQLGFLLFGLGSLASALTNSAAQLIGTRAFMGIGGALIMPATLSIITNLFPADERGKAIGVWAGTAGIGGALGPLTGGFLVQHFYFGSVFLVNLPIVLVGLLAGFFLIPTSKDPHAGRLDPIGAVLSVIGLVSLLYGIIEAPTEGWTDPKILTGLLVGAVLLTAFGLWERHSDHPMLDIRFFRNPRFSAASGAITLTFFAMYGMMYLLTQYLQFVLGYEPLTTGVMFLPFAAIMMTVAPSSSWVVDRIGTKLTVAIGMAVGTAGLLSMATLTTTSSYPQVLWRLGLMAFGIALTMAPATDSVLGSLPLGKAGVGSAVNDTTRQTGGALGVAVVGSVLSSVYGSQVVQAFTRAGVPATVAEQARSSIAAANGIAAKVGTSGVPGAKELAAQLTAQANDAFVQAVHWGVLVAAGSTLLGVFVALLFLPARPRAQDESTQVEEYVAEHSGDLGFTPDLAEPRHPEQAVFTRKADPSLDPGDPDADLGPGGPAPSPAEP